MPELKHLEDVVFSQLFYNRYRNLFYTGKPERPFFCEMTHQLFNDERQNVREMAASGHINTWIDFLTRESLKTFYAMNQYIHADHDEIDQLRIVYSELILEFCGEKNAGEISQNHFNRLAAWLKGVDPLLARIYSGAEEEVRPVVCAGYSPEFLLNLYGLIPDASMTPLLDIGCGEEALLPVYLRDMGYDAYGFDRIISAPEPWLSEADWFSFEFRPSTWKMVLANQSFSLHFNHFHQREGEDVLPYARLYMKILESLRPGGRFIYAPSLPFIESLLPTDKYGVWHHCAFDKIIVTTISRLF